MSLATARKEKETHTHTHTQRNNLFKEPNGGDLQTSVWGEEWKGRGAQEWIRSACATAVFSWLCPTHALYERNSIAPVLCVCVCVWVHRMEESELG